MNDLKGIIEDCNKSDLVSDKVIKKIIEIIGQEKWQDLHDKYSDTCTTMGELIITLNGIADLEKENAELKEINSETLTQLNLDNGELIIENEKLKKENAELKTRVGLSIECDKAQKDGEFCLGYGGDEDEPCEQCKNCIKCECGYYQLGETEKDEHLTKAKEIIKKLLDAYKYVIQFEEYADREILKQAEQFLKE